MDDIWTDGTLTVHARFDTQTLRVIRDGSLVAEATPGGLPLYHLHLAVDVAADRIWISNPLQEFRLSDLTRLTVHDDQIRAVTALGDGRVAAVRSPGGAPARLVVGRPGYWDHEVLLDDDVSDDPWPCVTLTDEQPDEDVIADAPTVTATRHGLVVADGQTGVAMHFSTDLKMLGYWTGGGRDETSLKGYATERGVLATTRWAGRESEVAWLVTGGYDDVRQGYGAFALPADRDRIWLLDDYTGLQLLDGNDNTVASLRVPGIVRAAHAAGAVSVLGGADFIHTATATDDGIVIRSIHFD